MVIYKIKREREREREREGGGGGGEKINNCTKLYYTSSY